MRRIYHILTLLRSHKRLIAGIGFFGVGFAAVVWGIENYGSHRLILNTEAAMQFLGGNWPTQANDHATLAFAFGPAFRIILVIGAVSGAWTGVTRIGDILAMQKMRLTDFLADRDRAIETRVLQVLKGHEQQEYRAEIHKAIQQGHEDFLNRYLPTIVGDEASARRIREQFQSIEF